MSANFGDLSSSDSNFGEEEDETTLVTKVNLVAKTLVSDSHLEMAKEKYYKEDALLFKDSRNMTNDTFKKIAVKEFLETIPFPFSSESVHDRREELYAFLVKYPNLRTCNPDLLRQRIVNIFGIKVPRMNSLQVDEDDFSPNTISGLIRMNISEDIIDEALNLE